MAQKGYNFVNGQLVLADQNPFDYGGSSKAQVYMTDAERTGRNWTNAITPTPGAMGGGGSSAPATTPTNKRTVVNITQAGTNKNNWNQPQKVIFSDGTSMNYNQGEGSFIEKYSGSIFGSGIGEESKYIGQSYDGGAAAPTIIDQPVQPSVQPTAPQQTAPVIQPTTPIKTNPAVQAAAEAEKAAIQSTFSRTDTILSAPQDLYGGQAENDNIYKVRAGYRRKSRLGA